MKKGHDYERRFCCFVGCSVIGCCMLQLVFTYHSILQSLLHYKSRLEKITLLRSHGCDNKVCKVVYFWGIPLPTLPTCCCCQGNDSYQSAVWAHADVKTARWARFNHVQTKRRCHVCDGLSDCVHVFSSSNWTADQIAPGLLRGGTVTMWSRENETWIHVRMQLYQWPAVMFLYEHAVCIVQDIIVVVRDDDGWRRTHQSNSAR